MQIFAAKFKWLWFSASEPASLPMEQGGQESSENEHERIFHWIGWNV